MPTGQHHGQCFIPLNTWQIRSLILDIFTFYLRLWKLCYWELLQGIYSHICVNSWCNLEVWTYIFGLMQHTLHLYGLVRLTPLLNKNGHWFLQMNYDFLVMFFFPVHFWINAVKAVVSNHKKREHKLLNIRFLQLNACSSQDKGSTLLHKHKGVCVCVLWCFLETKAKDYFLLEVAAL